MTDDDGPRPDDAPEPGSPEAVGEPDPEADFGPDVPEVDVPEVDIPEPPDPSDSDVPEDLLRSFWKLVAIFNVALLAVSLGPMLAVFRGEWVNGGLVFAVGVAFFAYGYARYQRAKRVHGIGD
ncbi:DUF7322 domain-containing protein [Halorientalis halophila]|uniref:DUF7322 domain-containing protein n=1 Tax=Halorientalis halophila TaxID=3108499 RepID=UPI0030080811